MGSIERKKWIFFAILLGFFLPLFPKEKSIGLIVSPGWKGENSFALRLISAGRNLGWEVTILERKNLFCLSKQLDWIFTLTPRVQLKSDSFSPPNYLMLFDPVNHYYDQEFCVKGKFRGYFGYLTTTKKPIYFQGKKERRHYPKSWYPTAQYLPYREVEPEKLFCFVEQWGNRYTETKYKFLRKCLAKQEYVYFFGGAKELSIYEKAYKGEIAYGEKSVQEKIFSLGICLVLHSSIHIQHEIPSGRIFEAASAGAVIISDRNPFVEKHFKDSVLYIDQTQSGEEMFSQIQAHMEWIYRHKEEAKKMAKRSYEIFIENFLLENQLLDFEKWHEENL